MMRIMCGIAQTLSSVYKNLSAQIPANLGSCSYSSQCAKSSGHNSAQLHSLSEIATKAIRAVRNNKVGNVSSRNTLYLLDKDVAKEFSALIMADRRENPSYVAEINSGLGFLTEELLQAGIPSINMFEKVLAFLPNLMSIENKYPGRATLRDIGFQQISAMGYLDWKDNSDKLRKYINIERRTWKEEPAIEIIGALGNLNYIHRLISTIVFQNTLAKFGRMLLHVAMPPSAWAQLTCSNEHYTLYRCHSVLFQTLFDFKLLGTLPRRAFYPHYRHRKKTRYQARCKLTIMRHDRRLMNVVRIEPKADLFKDNFTLSDMVPYYYFINHNFKCRSARVIPALENWVPGCGQTLIAHGYNLYTEFGELTPQEVFNLFNLFRSIPEFKQSSFVSCMDTYLMRMNDHTFDANSESLEDMFEFSLDDTQSFLE